MRAQQFICKKCGGLSNVCTFDTGATASRPGVLPVSGLIDPISDKKIP